MCRKKNEAIAKKLIIIFAKFEELLCFERGRLMMRSEHETLNEEFTETRNKIIDPQYGALRKLRDLERRAHFEMDLVNDKQAANFTSINKDQELRLGVDVSDEDLRDLLVILKKEREGLEVIQKAVSQNAKQLIVMERELNGL